MQRRAVAVYVALFVLIAGVAGVLTVTADTPEIGFENPDYDLSSGDTFEVDGNEYTVADITETEEEGSHGGGVERTVTATIERERTVEESETWANGSTVELDDGEWRVEITGEEPTAFTLVEVLDRQAILESDDDADNETIERDDGEYVAVTDESGETTLVPAEEYFAAPEERSYETGDSLEYGGQTVTVDEVTASNAVVVWEGTETVSIEIEQHSTVTIGETDFVAHFPDASTVTLSSDIEGYEAQVDQIEQFDQYNSGMTRVLILALLSSVLLLATAFIPSRY